MTGKKKAAPPVLEALKGYLEYWMSCGIDEVPIKALPDFTGRGRVAVPDKKKPAGGKARVPGHPFAPGARKYAIPASPDILPAQSSGPLTLDQIREEIGDCTRCRLHEKRQNIVFGSGNPKAGLVFVGEGPGAEEDREGKPFVGRAGRQLTDMIEKGMGTRRGGVFICDKVKREDVYICNVIKCRPPHNRDPRDDEISTCRPFLIRQVRAIRPRVIVALGNFAASALLGRPVSITHERGTWHRFEGAGLMLTYHPAYILRNYTKEVRSGAWEDMIRVAEELKNDE